MGRPTKRTPENVAAILAGLRKGTPLTVLCDELDLCDDTVRNWADADEALSRDIARAREAGEDYLAIEGLRIVDNVEEDPASRRVRSDYRLKLLAKFNPKRWGDKLQHADADGGHLPAPQFIVQPVMPGPARDEAEE